MDCILKRDVAYFYSWKSLVFLCTVDGLHDIWELRLCVHSQMPIPKSYSYRKAMTSMLHRNTGFSLLYKFCVYVSFLITLPKSPRVNGKADSPVTSKKCQLQMHQASRVCCGSLFHWYTGRARTTCLQCIIFLVMKSRFFLLYSIPNSVSILIRKRGRLTKSDMSCSKMRDRTAGARNSRQLFQVLKIWH